jgi:methionine aminopeptidase
MAFNSSCPANAKEEEVGNVTSIIYGAPHFQWGFESVDHFCGHNNGKLLDHGGRDEPTQQQPATRRSLLLLHHRHQSANYTSFGTNVT